MPTSQRDIPPPAAQNGHAPHMPYSMAFPPAAAAAPVPIRRGSRELGIVLLAFGIPLWLAGARYTVDGGRIAVNFILAWLTIPVQIAPFGWEALIALILVIGWLCSRVEIRHFPLRRIGGRIVVIGGHMLAGWALISVTDLSTTGVGIVTLQPDAWPISIWIAATWPAALAWTGILTFLPEWLILGGWRMLRG